jgi:hypothetical protein
MRSSDAIAQEFNVPLKSGEKVCLTVWTIGRALLVQYKGIQLGSVFSMAGKIYIQREAYETREQVCCPIAGMARLYERHIDEQLSRIMFTVDDVNIIQALRGGHHV